MIGFLRGVVAGRTEDHLILDVGGVGYRVFMPTRSLVLTSQGEELRVHTSMQVREDSMLIYGFSSPAEKDLFELLLTVSKVGPKVALSVLSSFEPDDLSEAVYLGDIASLSRVSGVGKKTAERIIVDLKDKMGGAGSAGGKGQLGVGAGASAGSANGQSGELTKDALGEAREALGALGYTTAEIQQALRGCREELGESVDAEQIVRFALSRLARGALR